jgi:hypothetical protein
MIKDKSAMVIHESPGLLRDVMLRVASRVPIIGRVVDVYAYAFNISKSQATRLLEGGGLRLNGKNLRGYSHSYFFQGDELQLGKGRFAVLDESWPEPIEIHIA